MTYMVRSILIAIILFTAALNSLLAEGKKTEDAITWKYKTSGKIYATPVIENNVLYIGSADSNFYAIDAKTGTEKWRYKTTQQILGNAIVSNNIACFESGNVLYGLNLQGTLIWKFTLAEGIFLNMHDEWDYYRSSPVLVGENVYIGTEKGKVFGLNIKTGTKVFECQTPTADHTIETTPAIYDGKIYFGDWNGVFYVYELSTTNLVWKYDTKTDNTSTSWVNAIVTDPVIYKDAVYFGGRSCNLYCLDAKTGTKKWMYHDNGSMWMIGGPVIVNDELFIGSSYQHVLHSFNALTGKKNWIVSAVFRVNSKPLVDGENVIVGTEGDTYATEGKFLALKRTNGDYVEKIDMKTQIYSTPVLKDGTIYFGAADGNVYALNKQEFYNTKYPELSVSGESTTDLGKFLDTGSFTKTVTIYNKGEAADSVSVKASIIRKIIKQTEFILAPKDSQVVTLTVDLSTMSPSTYRMNVSVTSNRAMVVQSIVHAFDFSVELGTGISPDNKIGSSFRLDQNYPNPFNPSTNIRYIVPTSLHVRLSLFDVLGREIQVMVDETKSAGEYSYILNAGNLSSGIYFCKLVAEKYVDIKKIMLLK
jgi:eukaryotic-like serine/threonine-protein kinase